MSRLSQTWGTEPHERALDFPCDRLIPSTAGAAYYRGITIQASSQVVFRWLCQLRIAPYSYDWIDNFGRPSPRRLTPGIDELAPGQDVMREFELVDFLRDRHLTIRAKAASMVRRICGDTAVSYCVIPEGAGTCRLLIKFVVCYPRGIRGWLLRRVLPWGDLIMMRRQLLNFKELAENTFTARHHVQERIEETMDDSRDLRIAGWAGIVFSVLSLIVIPLVISPPPPLGSSGAEFAAWHGEHRHGFLIGNYLGIAAFFPGFVQLVVLAARIRRREGATGWLSGLVLTTGTFTYAVFACSLVAYQALPFLVEPRLEVATEALGALAAVWFALDGLAALPFVLAVGWATISTGVLPRWFAGVSWLLAAAAVLMSLGGLTATPGWLAGGGLVTLIGFTAFFAWTFTIAVIFLSLDRARQGGNAAGD